jgi:adenylate kinase
MDEDVIRRRFSVYKNDTEPVAEYYKQQDKFETVKGIGSVEDIFEAISNCIESELAAKQEVDS